MPKKKKKSRSAIWFAQIPRYFYRNEAMYWSGSSMELENFRRVTLLEKDKLCIETGRGYVTVQGQNLTVAALEKGRILLKGRFQSVTFSYFGT